MAIEKIKHYTESIYYDLEQTAKICKTLGIQLFEKLNMEISAEEYNVLDTILCNPDICQRDLAKLILRDRANTGRLLNSLEKKGFINRFINIKQNRLVKTMKITEKGQELWNIITLRTRPIFEKCSEKITKKEIDSLKEALRKFREKAIEIVDIQI